MVEKEIVKIKEMMQDENRASDPDLVVPSEL